MQGVWAFLIVSALALGATHGDEGKAELKQSPAPFEFALQVEAQAQAQRERCSDQGSVPRLTKKEESKEETFSQLTLFLFGSGLALFVALLGWSDQIRGINKDTKELEAKFLEKTHINKSDFLSIVKPSSPEEQLIALTKVMASGKAQTVASVELLGIFHKWDKQWRGLERLSEWKYNLSVTLAIMLFLGGVISLFTNPNILVTLLIIQVRTEIVILMIPTITIFIIFLIIIFSNRKEKYFRQLLTSVSEKV